MENLHSSWLTEVILWSVAPAADIRVFIVDDSPIFVEAIMKLLSETPGIAVVGSAGETLVALQEIESLKPNVVILDLQLGTQSGLDVLKSIKAKKNKLPAVIVFSGSTERGYRQACVRLGADVILDKSQDYDRLAQVILSISMGAENAG